MRVVRNGFDNEPAKGKSAVIGKSPAQRRLGRILGGDRIAIIVTNRRARIGLKPQSISRFDTEPPAPPKPVQLGRLDQLLGRPRRDAKWVRR